MSSASDWSVAAVSGAVRARLFSAPCIAPPALIRSFWRATPASPRRAEAAASDSEARRVLSCPASCLPNSAPARSRSAAAERASSPFNSSRNTASAFSSEAMASARSLPLRPRWDVASARCVSALRSCDGWKSANTGSAARAEAALPMAVSRSRSAARAVLAIAGLLRGEGPGVVHHFLLVAGQRLEVGTAGGQLLLGLALIDGESRPPQLAPLVLDDPLELARASRASAAGARA